MNGSDGLPWLPKVFISSQQWMYISMQQCVQAPFMGFIQNDDRILLELVVEQTLTEQATISQILYAGLAGGSILKSDGVSHLIPQLNSHFICHPTEEEKTPNTPMHRPQINRMAKRTDGAQPKHIQKSKVPT
jgi:hypothetical protein